MADSGASFHMTRSADLLSDVRLCDDKVRIGTNHLIDVVGYGTLTVVCPGDLTVNLLDVAYVPDLAFNLFSLMAAHKIETDNGYVPFPLLTPSPLRTVWMIVIFPGYPCACPQQCCFFCDCYRHQRFPPRAWSLFTLNELLLRETAKLLEIELSGTLRPYTGCYMVKGYRKPIPNSTKSRASEKLGRVFVDLSGPKRTPSLLGKRYVMLVMDDFTRHAWLYFLKHKSDAAGTFRKFLADVRADGVPSKVENVRSDNGGVFLVGSLERFANRFASKQQFTNANSPKQNGVVERALGI
ncbi:unnamed protein product, partial [Laminaria digitata]